MVRRLKTEHRRLAGQATFPCRKLDADRGRVPRGRDGRRTRRSRAMPRCAQAAATDRTETLRDRVRPEAAQEAAVLLARAFAARWRSIASRVGAGGERRPDGAADGGRSRTSRRSSPTTRPTTAPKAMRSRRRAARPERCPRTSWQLLDQLQRLGRARISPGGREGQGSCSPGSRPTSGPDGDWTDERVIVFTEYRATQKWLLELLAARGFARDDRLLLLFGGMDRRTSASRSRPRSRPARIRPRPHPARDRRGVRGHRPPEPLLEADPLRDPLEPEPARAAQRPHRPPRPARR